VEAPARGRTTASAVETGRAREAVRVGVKGWEREEDSVGAVDRDATTAADTVPAGTVSAPSAARKCRINRE
jgi:hypothetical protein